MESEKDLEQYFMIYQERGVTEDIAESSFIRSKPYGEFKDWRV